MPGRFVGWAGVRARSLLEGEQNFNSLDAESLAFFRLRSVNFDFLDLKALRFLLVCVIFVIFGELLLEFPLSHPRLVLLALNAP